MSVPRKSNPGTRNSRKAFQLFLDKAIEQQKREVSEAAHKLRAQGFGAVSLTLSFEARGIADFERSMDPPSQAKGESTHVFWPWVPRRSPRKEKSTKTCGQLRKSATPSTSAAAAAVAAATASAGATSAASTAATSSSSTFSKGFQNEPLNLMKRKSSDAESSFIPQEGWKMNQLPPSEEKQTPLPLLTEPTTYANPDNLFIFPEEWEMYQLSGSAVGIDDIPVDLNSLTKEEEELIDEVIKSNFIL